MANNPDPHTNPDTHLLVKVKRLTVSYNTVVLFWKMEMAVKSCESNTLNTVLLLVIPILINKIVQHLKKILSSQCSSYIIRHHRRAWIHCRCQSKLLSLFIGSCVSKVNVQCSIECLFHWEPIPVGYPCILDKCWDCIPFRTVLHFLDS